jgi:recombinational DNA repair ATPase RecF
VLVGANGQGKTNLLEAIFFLATLKPLRAVRLAELVRFGAPGARVAGDFDGPGGLRRVEVRVEAGGRTALLDGKPLGAGARLEEYFEGLASVCFSPDDLLVVKGGPEGRRRLLDRAAFNRWPAVLAEARDYVRALRARNAALRTAPGADVEVSFRGPLVRAGARLLVRRRALVAELAPRVAAAFAEISGPGAPAALLAYRPAAGLRLEGDEDELAGRLDLHREDVEALGLRIDCVGEERDTGVSPGGIPTAPRIRGHRCNHGRSHERTTDHGRCILHRNEPGAESQTPGNGSVRQSVGHQGPQLRPCDRASHIQRRLHVAR